MSFSILLIYKHLVLIICYFSCPFHQQFAKIISLFTCPFSKIFYQQLVWNIYLFTCPLLFILTNTLFGLFACLHVITNTNNTNIFFTNILLGLVVFTIILTTACLNYLFVSKPFLTYTLFGLFTCLQVFSISLPTAC